MTTNNIEQTDIFSLFGIEDEYAERKKREEEERMKKQLELAKKMEETKKNSPSSPNNKAKEVFDVNSETIIYFYTETIDINDYFSTEELENGLQKKNKNGEVEYKKIEKNDLKNRLKKDYPVMTAGAELVYDKKQNMVVVVIQAKKKGNVNEESNKGSFASSKKIPFSILRDFIGVSKYFSEEYGTEVHADIYFDKEQQKFFMDIPKQKAHSLWVEVTESPYETAVKILKRKCIKCMEIHSHHIMPAIPSSQDDESEVMPILYAIIGSVDKFFPDLIVRTYDMDSGKHIKLNPLSIFENPFFNTLPDYDYSVVEVKL